jgi:hypothetical protein
MERIGLERVTCAAAQSPGDSRCAVLLRSGVNATLRIGQSPPARGLKNVSLHRNIALFRAAPWAVKYIKY